MTGNYIEFISRRLTSGKDSPETCLFLGATDTGKTTFISKLAGRVAPERGLVIIDADVGQSHLGPPTVIGKGSLTAGKTFSWEQVPLEEFAFTGSTSPAGNAAFHLAGLVRMVGAVRRNGFAVLIDTTGLVSGPGVALKKSKLEYIRPDLVIGFEREGELDAIFDGVNSKIPMEIIRIPVTPGVGRKSQEERAAFRAEAYRRYFTRSRVLILDAGAFSWQEIPESGCALETDVLRETHPECIPVDTIVSLRDLAGRDFALGILRKYDPEKNAISLQTIIDPSAIEKVTSVVAGLVRLKRDFHEG